jgi:hypothetical protein
MIDLTKPKYTRTMLGVKVRAHRIFIQWALIISLVYFYGWGALVLAVAMPILEILPYTNWDRWINPWLRKEVAKHDIPSQEDARQRYLDLLKNDFPELRQHSCADCDKQVLTTDIWPAEDPQAEENTSGVWVESEDAMPFVLCDDCAEELYNQGRLGYSGSGAFMTRNH